MLNAASGLIIQTGRTGLETDPFTSLCWQRLGPRGGIPPIPHTPLLPEQRQIYLRLYIQLS
jgi:hypothetical protein